jgi:predicted RNase H-like nuclease (RuvC/YqgF family)
MLEEFVKLTGVNVSYRYYTENIEPVYMHPGNSNKEEWCAEWVKSHKKNIVKGHVFDIEALSRDISLMNGIKAENARIKEEAVTAKTKATNLELENESLKNRIEILEEKNDKLDDKSEQLKAAIEAIDEKDKEITALKAKLYDMMIAAA